MRDSALSTYHHPGYGVSFRYPRTYLLLEDFDSEDPSILHAQQELAAQQPGSILISTVTIPPDAYPNTTFRSGSLQLVVNPRVTPETCQSFAAPADAAYLSGSTPSIQGITFHWRERGWAAAGTGSDDREYAGFYNGTCYEFFLEIVTDANPDAHPGVKEAVNPKIMRQFDKIVSSLQIHNPQTSFRPQQSPFWFTPLEGSTFCEGIRPSNVRTCQRSDVRPAWHLSPTVLSYG